MMISRTINKLNLLRFVVLFITDVLIIFKSGNCQNNLVNLISNVLPDNSVLDTQQTPVNQTLSGTIPLILTISPYKTHFGTIYVPSNVKIKATVTIRDLITVSNKSDEEVQWSTKDGVIPTSLNSTSIEHTFQDTSDNNFIRVEAKRGNETGSAQVDFSVRAPVNVSDPIGKLFIEHGEMLDVKLSFRGSAPFNYCYKFCIDGNIIPCDFCFPYSETYENELNISHYLHSVGQYTLMFDISNIISRETKHYTIKINDTVRDQSLPFVPIVCSILAVFILITGAGLHLHFRKTVYTETANFDFVRQTQEDDDWEEELSFIQRVRYLFCGDFQEDDYNENSRLLDTTVVGGDRVNKVNGT